MRAKIDERLAQLGIVLPTAALLAGSYLLSVFVGSQLIVSVNCRSKTAAPVAGASARRSASRRGRRPRACAVSICWFRPGQPGDGDLDRVRRVIRLGGFVQAGPGFSDHPKVINGASELMVERLRRPAGRHTRVSPSAHHPRQ
ncbi:MAG: RidA family protein [Rhodospirillales bacterium]|nr:RidA family protein [Rhodospirillales bacterium]